MENLKGGNFNKFLVFKWEDCENYLHEGHLETLDEIDTDIMRARQRDGKSLANLYLVINTDEPYADEVIEIMKRHGHWG